MGMKQWRKGSVFTMVVCLLLLFIGFSTAGVFALTFESEDGETSITLMGLANLGMEGLETVSGKEFADGIVIDGRIAFILKGKIKGDTLLTIAIDSEKPGLDLYERIEPEKYYPVYGDQSSLSTFDSSHGKLFVLVQRGASYLTYGKMDTGMTDVRLAAYQRSLRGAKIYYETSGCKFIMVQASTRQIAAVDEFPVPPVCGTIPGATGIRLNRTSGPYYLTHYPVVPQTERVFLVFRDQNFHFDKEKLLQQNGIDYSVDYLAGQIVFTRELPSLSPAGDAVFVRVEYEYLPSENGLKHHIWGIRGQASFWGSRGGISYISDTAGDQKEVYGLDFHFQKPWLNTTLEYAQSVLNRTPTGENDAFRAEANITFSPTFMATTTYTRTDKNYTDFSGGTPDLETLTMSVQKKVMEPLLVTLNYQSTRNNLVNDATISSLFNQNAGLTLGFVPLPNLGGELSYIVGKEVKEDVDPYRDDGSRITLADNSLSTVALRLNYIPFPGYPLQSTVSMNDQRDLLNPDWSKRSFTTDTIIPLPKLLRTEVTLRHNLMEDFLLATGAKLSRRELYTINHAIDLWEGRVQLKGGMGSGSTTLYETHTLQNETFIHQSIGYQPGEWVSLNIDAGRQATENPVSGELSVKDSVKGSVTWTPWKNLGFSVARIYEDFTSNLADGFQTSASWKLSTTCQPVVGGALTLSYEDTRQNAPGLPETVVSTLNLEGNYAPSEKLQITTGVQEKVEAIQKSQMAKVSIQLNLKEELILKGEYLYSRSLALPAEELISGQNFFSLYGVYRPGIRGRIGVLGKLETQLTESSSPGAGDVAANLGSIGLRYDLSSRMNTTLQWAVKENQSLTENSSLRMLSGRVSYLFYKPPVSSSYPGWDFAYEYRSLTDLDRNDTHDSASVDAGGELVRNLRLCVGYNFSDYEEPGLMKDTMHYRGWYLRMAYVF